MGLDRYYGPLRDQRLIQTSGGPGYFRTYGDEVCQIWNLIRNVQMSHLELSGIQGWFTAAI